MSDYDDWGYAEDGIYTDRLGLYDEPATWSHLTVAGIVLACLLIVYFVVRFVWGTL